MQLQLQVKQAPYFVVSAEETAGVAMTPVHYFHLYQANVSTTEPIKWLSLL